MNGWQAEAVTAPAVTPSCFFFQYNTLFSYYKCSDR